MLNGYGQKSGINSNEIFSQIFWMSTICVVLAIADVLDLDYEQLDIKIAFLHDNLDEEVQLTQLKGSIDENENLVS